jgi:sec-independent protein translocase protein TatA
MSEGVNLVAAVRQSRLTTAISEEILSSEGEPTWRTILYRKILSNCSRSAYLQAGGKRIGLLGMFGLGFGELILILLVVLVVFGPGKLPEFGKALGEGIRDFQRTLKEPAERDTTPQQKPLAAPDKPEKE